jgi:Shikimate 5-dehydrogenase
MFTYYLVFRGIENYYLLLVDISVEISYSEVKKKPHTYKYKLERITQTMNITFSADTKLMGVVGYPLKSGPRIPNLIFNEIFKEYGIDAVYMTFSIKPEDLAQFVMTAKFLEMPGFGVTMPHKSEIIPHLDYVSEEARKSNSVNLVIIRNGKTYGYGFDGIGYAKGLDMNNINVNGRNVLILGAGSIVPIIALELAKRHVNGFTILNRTVENAKTTAELIFKTTGISPKVGGLTKKELDDAAFYSDLVIQCTSQGMTNVKDYEYLGFIDMLPNNAVVTDVIAFPVVTSLLGCAQKRSLKTLNGLSMITNQMPETLEQYFNRKFPEEEIIELSISALKGLY